MQRILRTGGVVAAAALALTVAAEPATAQAPRAQWDGQNVSAEGRVGITFPVGDLSDQGAQSALAFTGDLFFNFDPRWSVYAGWTFHDFNCDGCPDDLASSGPHAGAKYLFSPVAGATPWARGGLLFGRADAFQAGQDVSSSRRIGLELATGVDVPLAEQVSLTSSVWFSYYSANLPIQDIDMAYFLLDVGGQYRF